MISSGRSLSCMRLYRLQRDRERVTIQAQYAIIGFISSGTYGKVYKGQVRSVSEGHGMGKDTFDSTRGELVAIKKFKPDREGEVNYTGISQSACREIMLNREIQHEHVTALRQVVLQDKSIFLVFEYCEHDFLQIIHHHSQTRTNIPESTLKSLLWQLLNGVNYLHANWIVHRDLKPANILVTDHGVVKIGDLGLARSYHSPLQSLYSSDKVVVTIWYRSPDLLLGARHYTPSVDIWSVGCIMGELLYLRPMFKGDEAKPDPHSKKGGSGVPFQKDQLQKIFDTLGLPTKEDWPSIVHLQEYPHLARFEKTPNVLRQWYNAHTTTFRSSPVAQNEGLDLLLQLLKYDPTTRITARQSLTHKYFGPNCHPAPSPNCFEAQPGVVYPVRRVTPDDSDPKMSVAGPAAPSGLQVGGKSTYNALSALQTASRPGTGGLDSLPVRSSKRARYD